MSSTRASCLADRIIPRRIAPVKILPNSRRRLSSTSTAPPPPPPPAGLAHLPSRRVLRLAGPDAAKFLRGAVTASVVSPSSSSSVASGRNGSYAAFLTAQGRVRHDVFVFAHVSPTNAPPTGSDGDVFLLDVDAEQAHALARLIQRYKLRARFDVRVLDPCEATVWQAWSDRDRDSSGLGALGGAVASTYVGLPDFRAPGMGVRLLSFADRDSPPPPAADALERATEHASRIRRYLLGVPEGQRELAPDSALPLESNLDLMGGIDFHKGCYVGQELTIRTKHRGVVRKRVLPCVAYGGGGGGESVPRKLEYVPRTGEAADVAGSVPGGASIGRAGKRGRSAGKWLGGVGNVGLALCRLETMTDVELPGEVGGGGSYDPADEFVVEWKQGEEQEARQVKVRAFVPDWIRKAIPKGDWWASERGGDSGEMGNR